MTIVHLLGQFDAITMLEGHCSMRNISLYSTLAIQGTNLIIIKVGSHLKNFPRFLEENSLDVSPPLDSHAANNSPPAALPTGMISAAKATVRRNITFWTNTLSLCLA